MSGNYWAVVFSYSVGQYILHKLTSGDLSWVLAMPFIDMFFKAFAWYITRNPHAS
jgi:hypothetical protein